MGRDHSVECPKCGVPYGGLNGSEAHGCDPFEVDRHRDLAEVSPRDRAIAAAMEEWDDWDDWEEEDKPPMRALFARAFDAGHAAGWDAAIEACPRCAPGRHP